MDKRLARMEGGASQNQLPRRVLAKDFFYDVALVKSPFYFFQGKQPQAWDIVLQGDLGFESDFLWESGDYLTLVANR